LATDVASDMDLDAARKRRESLISCTFRA
jgi:hypothetical protein